jgi:hypothetical protein
MSVQTMKKKLIETNLDIFRRFGLVYYTNVIVCWFDPYSIGSDPPKTFWRLTNAWLRLHDDGRVSVESLEHSYYIDSSLAERLAAAEGTPLHYLENSNIYPTKQEADLAKKPFIPIPEKIEVHGAIIPYSHPILQSLIIEVIDKFGKGHATATQIIDYLTQKPVRGGGWYTRSVSLIESVQALLETMCGKGILTYNEQTKEYVVSAKPGTTTLRGS